MTEEPLRRVPPPYEPGYWLWASVLHSCQHRKIRAKIAWMVARYLGLLTKVLSWLRGEDGAEGPGRPK